MEMTSTTTEPGGAQVDASAEANAGAMSESEQARQARAEALGHIRAARAARAKYSRLAGASPALSQNIPQDTLDWIEDEVFPQSVPVGDRISRQETSYALSRVLDHFREAFIDDAAKMPPVLKAILNGTTAYAPLLFLKPERRGDGVGAMVRDPRVWPLGLILLMTLGDAFGAKIWKVLEGVGTDENSADQFRAVLDEFRQEADDRDRVFLEKIKEAFNRDGEDPSR
jgi:hypothetical protein